MAYTRCSTTLVITNEVTEKIPVVASAALAETRFTIT